MDNTPPASRPSSQGNVPSKSPEHGEVNSPGSAYGYSVSEASPNASRAGMYIGLPAEMEESSTSSLQSKVVTIPPAIDREDDDEAIENIRRHFDCHSRNIPSKKSWGADIQPKEVYYSYLDPSSPDCKRFLEQTAQLAFKFSELHNKGSGREARAAFLELESYRKDLSKIDHEIRRNPELKSLYLSLQDFFDRHKDVLGAYRSR